MKIKKIYFLFVVLIITSYCFAEENEQLIMQIEGLDVYTLENVKEGKTDINPGWEFYYNSISRDHFEGTGYCFSYRINNSLLIDISLDYTEGRKEFDEQLVVSSIRVRKEFRLGRYVIVDIGHSINYLNYEVNDWFGELFSPSVNYSYGFNYELIPSLNVYYKISNIIWYTDPDMKLSYSDYDLDINVAEELYDKSQHIMGLKIKF